jgi:hypothetical protein
MSAVKKQAVAPITDVRPRYVTLQGAYEYLGRAVPVSTIRWWIAIGRLSKIKPGRLVMLDINEIDALLARSTRRAINVPEVG